MREVGFTGSRVSSGAASAPAGSPKDEPALGDVVWALLLLG